MEAPLVHGQYIGASPDIWEPGICERCGRKSRMTKLRRYLLNREGMKERGLIHD